MNDQEHNLYAKKILKFLIERIQNYKGSDKYITYGELAKLVDYPQPYTFPQFPGRIGTTLGEMGHLLDEISAPDWKGRIPLIQSMVVNKNKKLPSDGLKEFFYGYPDLSDEKKRDFIRNEFRLIFDFGDRWFYILKELGVENTHSPNANKKNKSGLYNPFGNEGSPEHRKLRDYVASHPKKVGAKKKEKGQVEYPLKSGDLVDVFLTYNEIKLGVEVKSVRSGDDDHERGIYQCIKYREVLKAESIIKNEECVIDCLLVHENELSRKIIRIAKKLSVKTIRLVVNK